MYVMYAFIEICMNVILYNLFCIKPNFGHEKSNRKASLLQARDTLREAARPRPSIKRRFSQENMVVVVSRKTMGECHGNLIGSVYGWFAMHMFFWNTMMCEGECSWEHLCVCELLFIEHKDLTIMSNGFVQDQRT